MTDKIYTAIGLMSGTSLDGMDAAVIETDGKDHSKLLGFTSLPYDAEFREEVRRCLGKTEEDDLTRKVEKNLTLYHADLVRELLAQTEMTAEDIDVIGFHGQSITHLPDERFTWQIGNGAFLASETGIDVVNDFRAADVKAGGQGAPLLPIYHKVCAPDSKLTPPFAIVNIGGVANITYIGSDDDGLIAFDTGPGNALIDDFIGMRAGKRYDTGGEISRNGNISQDVLDQLLSAPYFKEKPPKSLDRNPWDLTLLSRLPDHDGAATLTAFTVYSIQKAFDHLPEKPKTLVISGGGRHNTYMMEFLEQVTGIPIEPAEMIGWDGDSIEAEGFAYFAVRHLLKLPITFAGTTGVKKDVVCGVLHKA